MTLSLLISKISALALGVAGLSFLVGIHELGHFFFCKLFRVKTPSFSIGFGPKLISRQIGETEFSLSAIPLGGYVEIAGMREVGQGDQEEAERSDEYSFTAKPYYQKLAILLGGIMVNISFAYLALILLFALYGMPATPFLSPRTASAQIASVATPSPAATAGIQAGDRLIALDGNRIDDTQGMGFFFEELKKRAGQTVSLTIRRGTEEITRDVTLNSLSSCAPLLGTALSFQQLPPLSWSQAIREGFQQVNRWISGTFGSLSNMVRTKTTSGLGGPIAVLHGISAQAQNGAAWIIVVLAFISVGLACLNLLPLPIFDGGQLLFYTIEAVTGCSLDKARLYIHYISWITVLLLMIYLSWRDAARILSGA